MDELFNLNKSSNSAGRCPYGEPPRIIHESESVWTINGVGKDRADQSCQPIILDANACATCELNPYRNADQERTASEIIQHLFTLDEYIQAGVVFGFDTLTRIEWRGLALLKLKRNKVEIKELEERKQRPNGV